MGNFKSALEVCLLFLGSELQQLFRSIIAPLGKRSKCVKIQI